GEHRELGRRRGGAALPVGEPTKRGRARAGRGASEQPAPPDSGIEQPRSKIVHGALLFAGHGPRDRRGPPAAQANPPIARSWPPPQPFPDARAGRLRGQGPTGAPAPPYHPAAKRAEGGAG